MDNCFTGRRDRSRQTPEKDVLYIIPAGPVSRTSMDVTHSPAWREVLIVSGVSILNVPVFKRCSRCSGLGSVSTGCWVWVPKIAGCKTPVSFDFPPVRLHSCLSADTVPLKGRTVWLDCGSCLLQSVTSSGGV